MAFVCSGKERRPIVEFAIENVNILQKRAVRQKMSDGSQPERRPLQRPAVERPQVRAQLFPPPGYCIAAPGK